MVISLIVSDWPIKYKFQVGMIKIGRNSMLNETLKQRIKRTKKIIAILKDTYPGARIALNYSNPWQLLVAVVLSAQCTDKKVNEVTAKLFKKYKTLDDYANADRAEFEQDIRPTGFYRNKAKNILKTAKIIKEKYNGKIPQTIEELIKLPGVARKTANIILGNAFGVVEGIAVDTHVHRISQRLRLVDMEKIGGGKKEVKFSRSSSTSAISASAQDKSASRGGVQEQSTALSSAKKSNSQILDYKKDADADKIEKELMRVVPKQDWFNFTYLIIDHGRAVCTARNPKCFKCSIKHLCPVSR